MRALVTGAAGFVGQWLCRALLREGWSVDGISLDGAPTSGILTASERAAVRWTALDLSWRASDPVELRSSTRPPASTTERTLSSLLDARPDVLFHLAGIALQSDAAADRQRAFAVNVGGLQLLQQALVRARDAGMADPDVLVVGTSEQYGRHESGELPLVESAECRPATPYGETKLQQEELALLWESSAGHRVVCTRSFNHSGPGQSTSFLLPGLVARALAAKRSGGEVTIGNTDVIRDFLHVEDVVAAYISLVARGESGEVYNVCSGEGVRIGDLAAEVLAQVGVTTPLRVDPALQRAVDVPVLVGDNTKLRQATGWAPRHSRSDIIADLLASLDAAS